MPAPHYDFVHATAALIAILALLSGLALLAVKQVHEQVRCTRCCRRSRRLHAARGGEPRRRCVDRARGVDRRDQGDRDPIAIDRTVTRQVSEHEVPLVVQVPMSLLIGVTLAGLAYWSAAALPIHGALLPTPALGMPLSLVLIGFFFMITRQNVISQIVGLLTLENGVFVATVAIAPGLPFAIGFLLLLDLLPAVLFYGCSRALSRRAPRPRASRT